MLAAKTLERRTMGITGNLKTMVLAELLQWLSQGQKTGTLVIDNGKIEKRIYFRNGTIISSASTSQSEHLGSFLVGHGYISEAQLDEAIGRQKTEDKLIGQLLVDMGVLEEDDLHQMLRFKAEESIYDVFAWEEGDFRFLDRELPEEVMIPMSLDVQWLVLEGSRRLDELTRLREQIPSPLCVVVSVTDLTAVETEQEEDKLVLDLVDDHKTVEEISQECHLTVFFATQILAQHVLNGNIKVVRPRIIEVEVIKERPESAPIPTPTFIPQPVPMANYPPHGFVPAPVQAPGQPLDLGNHPGLETSTPVATAPAAPKTEAERILHEADETLSSGNLEKALAGFRNAAQADGADDSTQTAIAAGEAKVVEALEREGIKLTSVPRLNCDMSQLTQLKISPQEGFMLTRLNGSYDLKSLLKMNPASKLDTQMLFWRLKKSGHVAF